MIKRTWYRERCIQFFVRKWKTWGASGRSLQCSFVRPMRYYLVNEPYNIFFLDCGRKYYSVDSIKKLIDNASAAGFNYIQLAVGNDGLRFLLDDMSLTVNGTTYDSSAVSNAIHAGNETYYNFDVDELTQDEMDTIIAYANEKGMGVIPCVNTPGHMDAILSAATSLTGTNCAYNGSVRTIDVTNSTAVAFTWALLQKYIDYFAGKGCQLFNMGADEYANDKYDSGSMGFGNLQSTGKYSYYVQYVNQVAAMIKTAGMNPMAFNDGIYFKSNTSSGTIDTDIVVCYWSAGWGSYKPMPASELASKGFRLINTHGDYYWVLGKNDAQCSAEKASKFDPKTFQGSTIDDPLGSMFCIWADYPGAETEANVISKTADTIAAFGATLPKDGIVISDAANNGGQLETGKTMVLTANKTVDWTTSDAGVASIAASDPEAVMAAAETGAVNATAITVTAVAPGSATITAAAGGKTATYAVTVNDPGTKTVTVTVGGTTEVTVDGDVTGTYETGNTGIATVTTEPVKTEAGTKYTPVTSIGAGEFYVSTTKDDPNPTLKVTLEGATNNQYYVLSGEKYCYPNAYYNYGWTPYWSFNCATATQKRQSESVTIANSDNGAFVVSRSVTGGYGGNYSTTAYLTISDGELAATGTQSEAKLYFYAEETVPAKTQTKITFKGVSVGQTSVTIGGVKYNINVIAEDLTKVTPLTIEYWITNAKVYESNKNSASSVKISAAEAYSEEGIAVEKSVPATANTYFNGDTAVSVYYWQTMRLAYSDRQTAKDGNDGTSKGETLTHIRYLNSKWQYKTLAGDWKDFQSDDQVVAYYLQKTDVTKEITTYVKDWGFDTSKTTEDWSGGKGQVALTVAVVYPDGTVSPAEGELYAKSTTIFNYWDNRDIGIVSPTNNSDYTISKITVTSGKRDKNTDKDVWYADDTITWEKEENAAGKQWYNETTVWDKTKDAGTTPVVNGAASNITWSAKNTAKLVLIYLEPVEKKTNLNLVYFNRTSNETILSTQVSMKYTQGETEPSYTTELMNASDEVIGSKKNWASTTPDEADYLPDDAYVVNSNDKKQTFSKEISTVPDVSDKYRSGLYKYDGAEISEDGKTLTLYYVVDTSKLSANYVLDFGTPVKIPMSDIVSNPDDLENVTWNETALKAGTLAYNDGTKVLTYTPTKVLNETYALSFTLKFTSGETQKVTIGVMPASNVLYEENFLTTEEARWSNTNFANHTTAQQTQKVGDTETTYNVFGYDSNASAVGANGYWQMENLDQKNDLGKPLTTTFYGNAFDLIGDCGEDTGRVLIAIVNKDDSSQRVKMIDVDTRYNAGTLHQVPLAHAVMTGDAHYQVEIYATKLPESTTTVNTPRGVASYAYDASAEEDEFLNQVLDAYGITMDDVDYISTATADTLDADSNGVAVYSSTRTATSTITHKKGTHVEIDGFRVYRSTADDVAKNYPESEQNVEYKNILDVVGSVVTAYTEGGTVTECAVTAYEAQGGPQNEIYLGKDQSVVIQVSNAKPIQVSLRAVSGETSWSTSSSSQNVTITSNTEMYYTITPDSNNTVTITNKGENLLALGNVKAKNTEKFVSAENMDPEDVLESVRAAYGSSSEEPEVFTPETFTVKTTSTPVIRNKVVTLKVNVSSDVAYITVNGVKYTRTGLQGLFQKTRTIRVVNTVKKGQTKTYEVVAYNADGVASETITVTG